MEKSTSVCHVVALPYPGRGHVNPMMNICKQLASRKQQNILISFVVTEEWHGLIGSEPIPENLRFATLPNVIPSEHGRADDFAGFVEAVSTKLEAPFEQLLDRLEPPVTIIMADCFMVWAVGFGNRKNIQVALLSPGSASVFSIHYHFELLVAKGHFPVDLSENGHEVIDYVPGISRTRLADFPTGFRQQGPRGRQVLHIALEAVYGASKAHYLLFTSAYELESQTVDALKAIFTIPVYTVGPSIPYFQLENNSSSATKYFQWLDSQPKQSVLYISMGSFLSVSNAQLDEIIAGVQNSGVKYLWVARGDASRFKDGCGDIGYIVPWCDQLMVLCHPSIGGFLTHCGWNSTMEAAFAGIPVLAAPIFADQFPNKKKIVEDWKIGYSVKNELEPEKLVTRDEIAELVKRFMDLEINEGKEMRKRAEKLQEACRSAIGKGGSSDKNLDAFIENISQSHGFFS